MFNAGHLEYIAHGVQIYIESELEIFKELQKYISHRGWK